jgi:hypothetical protein
MKLGIRSLVLSGLALMATMDAAAQVRVQVGISPFAFGGYPPPVVYQPDPYYYAPPPVVYVGGGYWGGHDRHWRGREDRRGHR